MRKHPVSPAVAGLVLSALLPLAASAAGDKELAPGQLAKSSSSPSVYFIDEDLTRHTFPNAHVFKSWFPSFNDVVSVDDATMDQYPLGDLVPYKPSARLVKQPSDPKVYAVDEGGILRWLKTEDVARDIFGDGWNKLVDDVPDVFFAKYAVGDEVADKGGLDLGKLEKIKDIKETLRAKRLKLLEKSGAGEDDRAHFGFGKSKIAVCHKFELMGELTVYVPTASLTAHTGHGDAEGVCGGDNDDDNDDGGSTPVDTTKPVISASSVDGITATGAVAHVTADEDVKVKAYYSTTTPVDVAAALHVDGDDLKAAHDLTFTGLTANTDYYVSFVVTDAAGNATASSEEKTFKTLEEDATGPVITTPTVGTITDVSAVVHVEVNEPSTIVVLYGTTNPADVPNAAHADSSGAVSTFDANLTGLTAETMYHVVVKATDAVGNETVHTGLSFTTTASATPAP